MARAAEILRCAGCNAPATWSPGEKAVACTYCEATRTVEAAAPPPPEVALADFESTATRETLAGRTRLTCGGCGATLDFEGRHAGRCDFCGASAVDESNPRGGIAPSAIAPFSVTREQAAEAYRAWVDERPFVPKPVREGVLLQEMRGLYVPFWVFDLKVQRWFTCWAGYVEDHATAFSDRRDREVHWIWRKGWNEIDRKNLAICGSLGLPDRLRKAFEPFDVHGLQAYDAAYLSGFTAEAPGPSPVEAWAVAERRLDEEQRRQIREDELGDADRIRDLNLQREYLNTRVRLVYLPMWVASYRFSGRVFRFVVDGRTGKAAGDVPLSRRQVAIAAGVGALILAIAGAVAAPTLIEMLRPAPAPEELHAPTPVTLPP